MAKKTLPPAHYGTPKLVGGTANPSFNAQVAKTLKMPLVATRIGRFKDGEVQVIVEENLRGCDVYVLQPSSPPVNDNLMELLVTVDALRRASVARITAVIPYFGYARQDRKAEPRAPISASLVAHLLETAGVNHVLTADIHAPQIQGFFSIPMDNLQAAPLFANDIQQKHKLSNLCVVSTDVGGIVRARSMARRLDVELAVIDKRRDGPGSVAEMNLIGNVSGKHCILIDDIIDTAGTMCSAAEALMHQYRATAVSAYATHGLFSGEALKRIENSVFNEVVVTNALPAPAHAKIRTLCIAGLFARAIHCMTTGESIAALYEAS